MGYFDIQVNGYAGVDFNNDQLSLETMHRACEQLRSDGVDGILATIITDDVDAMCRRLERIVSFREQEPLIGEMIAGIHIEGPFISPTPGFRGAHPEHAVRPADPDIAARLLDAAGGLTRILTLAPEHDADFRTTRFLADRGVIVSAGHADPPFETLRAACDAGLGMFTHLGNGCPPTGMHRHDNVVQRALALADRLWFGFIADGAHIPFFALGNYLKLAGLDHAIVTSDAVAPAGLGPGRFTLGDQPIIVDEHLVCRPVEGDHLAGSAISLPKAHANLVEHLHLSDEQATRLTATNPRKALGLAS